MNELIPIFPLETVVYPGDGLNLHIFEPRYKQLIADCSESKTPFGIPAVVDGKICQMGSLLRVTEITSVQPNGEMDIRTRALKVFVVLRLLKEFPGKLYSGAYVDYPNNEETGDPKLMREVVATVKKLHAILKVNRKFPKAEDHLMSYDVAHHIGLSLKQEYKLLALLDERERQEYLKRHLDRVLPVTAEMQSLKDKIKLNGHFKKLPGFDF